MSGLIALILGVMFIYALEEGKYLKTPLLMAGFLLLCLLLVGCSKEKEAAVYIKLANKCWEKAGSDSKKFSAKIFNDCIDKKQGAKQCSTT